MTEYTATEQHLLTDNCCADQVLKAGVASMAAKRRTRVLACSFGALQDHAAFQASKKQRMQEAVHFSRRHMLQASVAAWRTSLQVSC